MNLAGAARGFVACLHRPRWELASLSKALRAQCASTWPRLQPSSNDGTDECLRTVTAPRTSVTAPQMLRRYGASARSARARRTYDRIMAGDPRYELRLRRRLRRPDAIHSARRRVQPPSGTQRRSAMPHAHPVKTGSLRHRLSPIYAVEVDLFCRNEGVVVAHIYAWIGIPTSCSPEIAGDGCSGLARVHSCEHISLLCMLTAIKAVPDIRYWLHENYDHGNVGQGAGPGGRDCWLSRGCGCFRWLPG